KTGCSPFFFPPLLPWSAPSRFSFSLIPLVCSPPFFSRSPSFFPSLPLSLPSSPFFFSLFSPLLSSFFSLFPSSSLPPFFF
ncbi:hypothetical protein ACXWRW_11285, partial [Streptococcus pyogenes]